MNIILKQKINPQRINSVESFHDGANWWISAVSWGEERPNDPIPKKFLPKGKK